MIFRISRTSCNPPDCSKAKLSNGSWEIEINTIEELKSLQVESAKDGPIHELIVDFAKENTIEIYDDYRE